MSSHLSHAYVRSDLSCTRGMRKKLNFTYEKDANANDIHAIFFFMFFLCEIHYYVCENHHFHMNKWKYLTIL